MILYPSISLQDGHCVTLARGRLDEPHIWHVDPVEKASEFAHAGAEWLHLTDFDAVAGKPGHDPLIEEILRSAGLSVQVAGGIRTRERAEHWLDQGAGRVVVGTLAAQDPQTVMAMAKYHPDQIVLSIDVWQGKVMTEGWRTSSALSPEAFLDGFKGAPFAAVIVTDIDADIDDADASLGLVSGLAAQSGTPVIASGQARTLDDISRLKYVRNVSGAIVERALYRKSFTIDEALALAASAPEPVAEFI